MESDGTKKFNEWKIDNLRIIDVRGIEGDSAFLIDDGKTSIMYDSGFAFTGYKVAENIKKVLGKRKLDYIFLTHSHYDHTLGSVYVKKMYPDAKVVAGEYAKTIFEKPSARKVMRELDNKCAAGFGITEYEDLIDELSVDISVNDGDIIKAGDMEFTAVSFPGHTKCSFGFYLAKSKLLLSSETLGVYCGTGVVFPSYLIGYDITMKSIEKASEMDIENILIPHFRPLGREDTKKYLSLAKINAEETAREICEVLKNGGTDEDAFNFFKNKYYHGYIKNIYPEDAMILNTNIMVQLIKKELVIKRG